MVLSKVFIFFGEWTNPHTNIIHKVMPFKTTFFSADNKQRYFFETDTIVECV